MRTSPAKRDLRALAAGRFFRLIAALSFAFAFAGASRFTDVSAPGSSGGASTSGTPTELCPSSAHASVVGRGACESGALAPATATPRLLADFRSTNPSRLGRGPGLASVHPAPRVTVAALARSRAADAPDVRLSGSRSLARLVSAGKASLPPPVA